MELVLAACIYEGYTVTGDVDGMGAESSGELQDLHTLVTCVHLDEEHAAKGACFFFEDRDLFDFADLFDLTGDLIHGAVIRIHGDREAGIARFFSGAAHQAVDIVAAAGNQSGDLGEHTRTIVCDDG